MVSFNDSSEFCSLCNVWVAVCHSKEGEALSCLEYKVQNILCFSGQAGGTGMLMQAPCGNAADKQRYRNSLAGP